MVLNRRAIKSLLSEVEAFARALAVFGATYPEIAETSERILEKIKAAGSLLAGLS
jgi:hypothetical protein